MSIHMPNTTDSHRCHQNIKPFTEMLKCNDIIFFLETLSSFRKGTITTFPSSFYYFFSLFKIYLDYLLDPIDHYGEFTYAVW